MALKRTNAEKDSDKENASGNPDILGEQEDQDVIF